jgi:hypothetical protein
MLNIAKRLFSTFFVSKKTRFFIPILHTQLYQSSPHDTDIDYPSNASLKAAKKKGKKKIYAARNRICTYVHA